MAARVSFVAVSFLAVVLASQPARAQAVSTCSFDPATATVTVIAKGTVADLRAIKSTGLIRLAAVPCGGATLTNTDNIVILGTDHSNVARLTGSFAPGLTPEADGSSEIEIAIDMGGDADWLEGTFLDGARGADRLIGEGGRDELHGGGGEDRLEGGDGRDEYFGDSGNDVVINADAFGESVDCGDGATDDAEPDPLDTFVGCEL